MVDRIFIEPQEVVKHLDDFVMLDCRYRLTDTFYGEKAFRKSTIPGAFYFDLNKDMASPVKDIGGRHPLPDMNILRKKLENSGISTDSKVVCFDDNLSGAARMFLLLEILGVLNVKILRGGFPKWVELGYPCSEGVGKSNTIGKIKVKETTENIATHSDIISIEDSSVIDARENYRYLGEKEPIDTIPGRIPGAINIPYTDLMDGIGLKSEEELRSILKGSRDGDIIYCGSGVTSCINYIAMKSIGIQPRLYVGSYSDWISRNLKVESGK